MLERSGCIGHMGHIGRIGRFFERGGQCSVTLLNLYIGMQVQSTPTLISRNLM